MSPLISAVASSWAETLFLVQLSKRPDVLEATANVLLEVRAPLDVISWFKGTYAQMCPKVRMHVHNIETLAYTYSHIHLQYGRMHIHKFIQTNFVLSLSLPSDVLPSSHISLCHAYLLQLLPPWWKKTSLQRMSSTFLLPSPSREYCSNSSTTSPGQQWIDVLAFLHNMERLNMQRHWFVRRCLKLGTVLFHL